MRQKTYALRLTVLLARNIALFYILKELRKILLSQFIPCGTQRMIPLGIFRGAQGMLCGNSITEGASCNQVR